MLSLMNSSAFAATVTFNYSTVTGKVSDTAYAPKSILEAYAYPQKGFYDYHIENGKFLMCSFDECIHLIDLT